MDKDALTTTDMDALLVAMQCEADKQRKGVRFKRFLACMHLLGLVVILIGVWCWHWYGFLSGMLGIFNLLSLLVNQQLDSKSRKATVTKLALADDMRAIGPLCNVLSFTDPAMRKLAVEVLMRLLPRLQASDAPLLTCEQRDLLFTTLSSENARLVLTTLKALEQIGNEKALPYVEKLVAGKCAAKTHPEVQQAAQHCLPFLHERISQNRAANGLLRPSQPTTLPDVLLRPATNVSELAPQQLLRAADGGE